MNHYKKFEDWFDESEGYHLRSERFFSESKSADPFKTNKILTEWLKTAWNLGYQSGKNEKT
jgi:hypothetical protein